MDELKEIAKKSGKKDWALYCAATAAWVVGGITTILCAYRSGQRNATSHFAKGVAEIQEEFANKN